MKQFKHLRILQLSSFKYQYMKDHLYALLKLGMCLIPARGNLKEGVDELLSPLGLKWSVWAMHKHKASIPV